MPAIRSITPSTTRNEAVAHLRTWQPRTVIRLDATVRAGRQAPGRYRYRRGQIPTAQCDPGGTDDTLVAGRASVAGWADEGRSAVIVYVFGGSLDVDEGLTGFPTPLNSYLLVATRSADASDVIAGVHRVAMSCPGEHWCHCGGCPDIMLPGVNAL
jgi:hypothetical protein